MIFETNGNELKIKFEKSDSDTEMRFVERQFWSLRELMNLLKNKEETKNEL